MPGKCGVYHEAGHAVLAVASRFHNLVDILAVEAAYGEAPVAISRAKVKATGRPVETCQDFVAAQADPEIAADGALVFLGGFSAERRYCRETGVEPDPALSENDYFLAEHLLGLAGVQTSLEDLETESAKRVDALWPIISAFAEELNTRSLFDPIDALDFITLRLGR